MVLSNRGLNRGAKDLEKELQEAKSRLEQSPPKVNATIRVTEVEVENTEHKRVVISPRTNSVHVVEGKSMDKMLFVDQWKTDDPERVLTERKSKRKNKKDYDKMVTHFSFK
jgi:hypothetical protein